MAFTIDEKLTAILALISNNYNYYGTAKQIGVDRNLLRRWYVEYGEQVEAKLADDPSYNPQAIAQKTKKPNGTPTVPEEKKIQSINEKAAKELAAWEQNPSTNVQEWIRKISTLALSVKERALIRASVLLESSTSLKDVTNLLSVLNDMDPIQETAQQDGYRPSATIRELTRKMIANANKIKEYEKVSSDTIPNAQQGS